MSSRSRKRAAAAFTALLLLALLAPPFITLNRYRASLAGAIGEALGRQVSVDGVSLRLLPQPGFDLTNVVVADDPAFSAEPLLRAEEVTAALRLTSLWRGRLEIARLDLKYPSINLVRGSHGRWNLEQILTRTAQQPAAPTGKTRPEARPRFPYISAEDARINWKSGPEKKVYALEEADFALWLDSEDEWAMRLTARPVRTDVYLTDTGTLRLEGTFRRAPQPGDTPFRFRATLEGAQLGQLTRMLYGRDRGWRGDVSAEVVLAGTPAKLRASGRLLVNEFRRFDIVTGERVRLHAQCVFEYAAVGEELGDIDCRMPWGEGTVRVTGGIAGLFAERRYDLALTATAVSVAQLLPLVRQMKRGVALDLKGGGVLDAVLSVNSAAGPSAWNGGGVISGFSLRSGRLASTLEVDRLEFLVAPAERGKAEQSLQVRPFPLPLGAAKPASVQARFRREDYRIELSGPVRVEQTLGWSRVLGLPAPAVAAEGRADVRLNVSGVWGGFEPPQASGEATLSGIVTEVGGLAAPLRIAGARVVVSHDQVLADQISAGFHGGPSRLQGWVRVPRVCPQECTVRFHLTAASLTLEQLNSILSPPPRRRWFGLRSAAERSHPMLELRAQGTIAIRSFQARGLVAENLTAQATLQEGKLRLARLRADLAGGRHLGEWSADFTADQPQYSGTGRLERGSLAEAGRILSEEWGRGRLDAEYQLSLSGRDAEPLLRSAAGWLRFELRDGSLRGFALDRGGPELEVVRLAGRLDLRHGLLSFSDTKLDAGGGIYEVSGTASLARELDLTLVRETGARALRLAAGAPSGYSITGTLAQPRVTPVAAPETQAALKTE